MNITIGSGCPLRWTIDSQKNSRDKPKAKLNLMPEDKATAADAEGQRWDREEIHRRNCFTMPARLAALTGSGVECTMASSTAY